MLEAPYGSKTKHAQHPQPAQAQLSQLFTKLEELKLNFMQNYDDVREISNSTDRIKEAGRGGDLKKEQAPVPAALAAGLKLEEYLLR